MTCPPHETWEIETALFSLMADGIMERVPGNPDRWYLTPKGKRVAMAIKLARIRHKKKTEPFH